jgi:hypothetical protein
VEANVPSDSRSGQSARRYNPFSSAWTVAATAA